MVAVRDLFNEWYARDTSKKIRAIKKAKGEAGEYLCTNPPYGYRKDSDNKKVWIVDEEVAEVVKNVFRLCLDGYGPSQIAKILRQQKILTPTAYWQSKGISHPTKPPADPYQWDNRTIAGILERIEYLGHTANFKTTKKSYKSKKTIDNPKEQWRIFENTHEVIIESEVWEKVQELRKHKRRPTKTGKSNLFSGLLYCADCGAKLYYCTTNYFEARQDHFVCSNYKSNTGTCSAHFIRAVTVEKMVLQYLQMVLSYIEQNKDIFVRNQQEHHALCRKKELAEMKRSIPQAQRRMEELDRLFKKLYEDRALEAIPDRQYQKLSLDYTREQEDLQAKIQTTQEELARQSEQADTIEQFVKKAERHFGLTELTPNILNDLVRKIYISAPDKSSGKRKQEIQVSMDINDLLLPPPIITNKSKTA